MPPAPGRWTRRRSTSGSLGACSSAPRRPNRLHKRQLSPVPPGRFARDAGYFALAQSLPIDDTAGGVA